MTPQLGAKARRAKTAGRGGGMMTRGGESGYGAPTFTARHCHRAHQEGRMFTAPLERGLK